MSASTDPRHSRFVGMRLRIADAPTLDRPCKLAKPAGLRARNVDRTYCRTVAPPVASLLYLASSRLDVTSRPGAASIALLVASRSPSLLQTLQEMVCFCIVPPQRVTGAYLRRLPIAAASVPSRLPLAAALLSSFRSGFCADDYRTLSSVRAQSPSSTTPSSISHRRDSIPGPYRRSLHRG